MTKSNAPPLARSVSTDVLDYDHVEPRKLDMGKDVLGLSTKDRQALGMSAPRTVDLEAPTLGGAELALADVLARGGAIGKADARRKR